MDVAKINLRVVVILLIVMDVIGKIKAFVSQHYRIFLYSRRLRWRRKWNLTDLEKKMPQAQQVDQTIMNDCVSFWEDKLGIKKKHINYNWFKVYNAIENDKSKLKYYIPDEFWYVYVDPFYTDINKATVLDDKNFYDLYFHDVHQPKTIVRKIHDCYLDTNYNLVSEDSVYELCKKETEVIIKPAVNSCGGAGIKFWKNIETREDLFEALKEDNIIVQEVVKQHKTMAHLHEGSLNTIRIMVLIHNNEVVPLSTVVRMGVHNAKVDNASSGGIVCGVDCNGRLKNCAYNTKAIRFGKHPQGAIFEEHVIPNYSQCIALVKRLAPRFAYTSRLQSWDIAIDEHGEPTLIEANLTFGQIDFQQMCNGPIFGDRTEEMLSYIIKHHNFIR